MAGKTDFNKLRFALERNEKIAKGESINFDKPKYLTPKKGETHFMINQPKDDESNLYNVVYIHFGLVDGNGKNRAVKCSQKKYGECPICDKVNAMVEEADKLEAAGNEEEAKEMRTLAIGQRGRGSGLKAQKRVLYNATNLQLENVILTLKPSAHNSVMNELCYLDKKQGIDATDIRNKKMINLEIIPREPWAVTRIEDAKLNISEEDIDRILNNLHDLTKVYVDYSPEQMLKALNGEDIWKAPEKNGTKTEEVNKSDTTKTETKTVETPKVKKTVTKVETKVEETATSSDDDDIAELDALLQD